MIMEFRLKGRGRAGVLSQQEARVGGEIIKKGYHSFGYSVVSLFVTFRTCK